MQHPDVAALPRERQDVYYEWAWFYQRYAVYEADEAHEMALLRARTERRGRAEPVKRAPMWQSGPVIGAVR